MSSAEANEIADILSRVKTWSIPSRVTLARQILESVEGKPVIEPPPRKRPLTDLIGLLKTDAPPPTDEEVERILEEERLRKYGG
jgi:hypothetical protein